jgi:transglutaminase-like putative cysteine protease
MTAERRMTLMAAIACVLVSVVLYPLFSTALWFFEGIGAVLVVAAVGLLIRRRTLPVLVGLAATLAGLLLYLNVVFEARRSLLGVIPTPASLSRLGDLASTGMTDANRYAPPVPNLPSLMILAVGGIGITAALTDLIAVRLRCTALAGLPLLVLFSVPVMMNAPHSQVGTAIIFCLGGAGYLAMLSADGRERIRVWGRLVSLWRKERTNPDTRALAAAGRRIGLASIVLALCAPLLIPGLHPSKLLSSGPGIGGAPGSGGGGSGLPSVLSQTIDALRDKHSSVVLTYSTTAPQRIQTGDPQYLRQYVFDTLTDSGWVANDPTIGAAEVTSIQAPPGLTNPLVTEAMTTTIHAVGLTSPGSQPTFLPVPYPPTSVNAPTGIWLTDPDFMVFSSGATTITGRTYTVDSLAVDPSGLQLSLATPPAINLSVDLALPRSYQLSSLKDLARRITSGDTTEYAKVDALATWLADHGRYDTGAPGIKDAASLVAFLSKTPRGVCVQYAWAMTVLTRLLGIPARVVSGYTAGTLKSRDHYVVTTKDSHAWPEVYFQGYGWVRFEPTPAGQGTSTSPNYMSQGPGTKPGSNVPPIVPSSGPSTGTSATKAPPGFNHKPISGSGPTVALAAKSAHTPWAAVLLAVLAAVALAAGIIAIAVPQAQRTRSGRAADRRRSVPLIVTTAVLAAAAGLVALWLYRLLSHTSGLTLGAGWATVGIAFGAACAAMLVLPATCRAALRRWRWMRAADDASRAHAAWREFRADLTDFGLGCRPSEPPRTLAERMAAELPGPAADAVRRLALAEERACYSGRPADSGTLRRDGATARRGVAAQAGRGARWRARLLPASLMTALADGAAGITAGTRPVLTRRPARLLTTYIRRSPSWRRRQRSSIRSIIRARLV